MGLGLRCGRLAMFLSQTIVLALLMGMLLACRSETAAGPKIKAEDVWARPAVTMGETSGESGQGGMDHSTMGTGAVFMTLVNVGSEGDRLVGARTDVAEVVEIHETRLEGDVMKMQLLPDGLEVPAEGKVELKPGGYHIMLIGIKQDLHVDDEFTLELEFEKSAPMPVDAVVLEP
jgi:copper(I)-binding protein